MDSTEAELLKTLPDNVGDILTIRYTDNDNGSYERFAKFIHRRDVSQADKIRAWNFVRTKVGDVTSLIVSPNQVEWFAKAYPSNV
jgi:hypothetical protein